MELGSSNGCWHEISSFPCLKFIPFACHPKFCDIPAIFMALDSQTVQETFIHLTAILKQMRKVVYMDQVHVRFSIICKCCNTFFLSAQSLLFLQSSNVKVGRQYTLKVLMAEIFQLQSGETFCELTFYKIKSNPPINKLLKRVTFCICWFSWFISDVESECFFRSLGWIQYLG